MGAAGTQGLGKPPQDVGGAQVRQELDSTECARSEERQARGSSSGPNVTPHVAQNNRGRRSAIDGRTTRHPGYATSQCIRKRIEEVFGWLKTVSGFRRTRYRGLARTQLAGYLVASAYNLVRMARLLAQPVAS